MKKILTTLAFAATVVPAGSAHATYSATVADTASGWTGVAITSCLPPWQSLEPIIGFVPNVGAYVAQASFNMLGFDEIGRLLAEGESAEDILAAIASDNFDSQFGVRQYGVAMVSGDHAAFTGDNAVAFAGDRGGVADGYAYSVQGNILTSENVLTAMESYLEEADACDMPELLVGLLEAGAANDEGDIRCRMPMEGIPPTPSNSVAVRVLDASGNTVVEFDLVGTQGSAVEALRAEFDAWRADNECNRPMMCGGE